MYHEQTTFFFSQVAHASNNRALGHKIDQSRSRSSGSGGSTSSVDNTDSAGSLVPSCTDWMVPEVLPTLSTVLLLVIGMAGLLGYVFSLGYIKVRFTMKHCYSIGGVRRGVYRLASKSHGFYTTAVRSDSIKYDVEEPANLVVNVAFKNIADATDFVNGLQAWDDLHPGMVGDPEIKTGSGFLRVQNAILARHYCAGGSGSPDVPASARSVETFTTTELLADWDTKIHQNISPRKLIAGCGLQMCLIKNKRLCNKFERDDKNNFLGMSPSFHKQYDGHGAGASPNVLISTEKIHEEQVEVATEDGGTEMRTRVDLRVQFMSQEAFDGCDGVLKDGSYKINPLDPTIWVTAVHVLDPERFKYYVEFKAAQTLKMWDV
ncbi:unnamed protein product [Ectocarpus sp. 4 AP-2014]